MLACGSVIGLAEMHDWEKMWQCLQENKTYCPDWYNRDDAAHPLSILVLEKLGRHEEATELFNDWQKTFASDRQLTEEEYVEQVLQAMADTGYTFNIEGTRQRICKIGL